MQQRKITQSSTDGAAGPGAIIERRTAPCLLLLALCSATVMAQGAADPIELCSRMTDTGARLACFDQMATQRRAETHGPSAAPMAPAPASTTAGQNRTPAATRQSDDTTGLDPEQIRMRRKQQGLATEAPKEIVTTVARLDAQPSRHYYFELDNGQVWASSNAEPALFLMPHETVRIRPGLFGAFFLKTAAGSTMRVYRLR